MHINPKHLKIIRIALISIVFLFFAVFVIALSKREAILDSIIKRVIIKAKNDYNLNVKIKSTHFGGLKTVVFDNISVTPENRDNLVYIKELRIGIRVLPLLLGNIKLSDLKMNDGSINLVKRDSISNYDFLFKKGTQDTTKSKLNLAKLINSLINRVLYKIPDKMSVRNFNLTFTNNNDRVKFQTISAIIRNNNLKSNIVVNNTESTWHLQGKVEPDNKKLDLILFADNKKLELPFLERNYKLRLSFDTVHALLKRVRLDNSELRISGALATKNMLFSHPKITENDIIVPDASIEANMLIGKNYISVDSSSVIRLKHIQANPYIKYTLYPVKVYELKLHTKESDAQNLFDSFPPGLFESLDGMKVAGRLQYNLSFYLDSSKPDAVQFDSGLQRKNFRILSNGKTNFQRINGPFVYIPYESGKPVRDILIAPQNPNYVGINDISPILKNSVLTAEDPSFYSHHGFVMESFRNAITDDFKTKSFKRGGSTISMQLVKNVFLNKQKTIARKIEEILIVWLIENNHLVSKERMLEVYLNLIEWGRNVYGIGEASRYYFNKSPSELSLGESIFLANIVPRPKSSLYFFEPDGSLRFGLIDYFNFIGGVMSRRGLIPPDPDNAYGFYNVRLKENMRRQIVPLDSLATDRVLLDEDMENERNMLKEILSKKQKLDTISIHNLKNLKVGTKDTVIKPADLSKKRREDRRRDRENR
jgi:hypothetical protein